MSKRIFIFILLLSVYLSLQAQEGNTTDEDSAGRIIEMTYSLQ
jgi:hypothetical protein